MGRHIVISWHRYYDPETGRYMTPDPIGLEGGMNLYAYVEGNPVNNSDYNGLIPQSFQCASYVRNAQKACGAEYEKARDSYLDRLDKCKSEGIDCVVFGSNSPNCKKFESCCVSGYQRDICIGKKCAKDPEPWEDAIDQTLTPSCKKALKEIPLNCVKTPVKFPKPSIP